MTEVIYEGRYADPYWARKQGEESMVGFDYKTDLNMGSPVGLTVKVRVPTEEGEGILTGEVILAHPVNVLDTPNTYRAFIQGQTSSGP